MTNILGVIYNAIQNAIIKELHILDKTELIILINPVKKLELQQIKDSLSAGHMAVIQDFDSGEFYVYGLKVVASITIGLNEVLIVKQIYKQTLA